MSPGHFSLRITTGRKRTAGRIDAAETRPRDGDRSSETTVIATVWREILTLITFVEHNGKVHQVDAENGASAMRAASDNGVPGIFADCGGCMTCATCHVYVGPEWLSVIGAAPDDEATMLEMAVDPQPNSRLACQILIDDTLAGLVLNIPASQF